MSWWYPFKKSNGYHWGTRTHEDYETPDDSRKPIESAVKPEGNWWGPFHCERCARYCGSYGKTEEGAYRANHGTDDERFCETLGWS